MSTDTSLDASEIQDLEYMREEEKLARDVYRTLYGVWGLPVHGNISGSEQMHATQVEDILDKYRIPDPVVDDSTGVFVNQELAVLYDTLIAAGSGSSLQALYVGAVISRSLKHFSAVRARSGRPVFPVISVGWQRRAGLGLAPCGVRRRPGAPLWVATYYTLCSGLLRHGE